MKRIKTGVIAGGLCLSVVGMSLTSTPAVAKDVAPGNLLPPIEAPQTVDTFVGQSVQVRKDADGNPDSNMFNPRWAVTQVNAESLNGINTAVPLPMGQAPMLRSLTGNEHTPDKVNDGVVYDFSDVDGVDTFRSLNLYPGNSTLPVDVKAEFTLNGTQVQAQDLVGKGGIVTATYTITNNTRKQTPVTYKTLGGKTVTEQIYTDQPIVAIAQQLIPQNWGQFNPGSGMTGADGRGNYQVQWISLPFSPLSSDGKAQFGWTAVVPDGQGMVPKMMINAAPVYIPDESMTPPAKQSSGGGNGATGIPGASRIGSGVGTAAAGAGELVKGIVGLVNSIGTGVTDIKKNLPSAVVETKESVSTLLKTLGIGQGNKSGGSKLPTLPQVVTTLKELSSDLNADITLLRTEGANGQMITNIQKSLKLAVTAVNAMQTTNINPANAALKVSTCNQGPLTPGGLACRANQTAALTSYGIVTDNLDKVTGALTDISKALPQAVGDLEADALEAVRKTIDGLVDTLEELQTFLSKTLIPQITAVTDSIGDVFGAIDHGIAMIKQGAGPAVSDIGTGVSTIGSGIGEIAGGAGQLAPYVRELIGTIMSYAFAAKDVLKRAGAEINKIKGTMAGMMMRAHESPLPYGGGQVTVYQPKNAPQVDVEEVSQAILNNGGQVPDRYAAYVQPTSKLFGAFQFVFDPANNNKPDTLPRILLGLVALLLAGIALPMLARRRKA